jgi:hypothetical protein
MATPRLMVAGPVRGSVWAGAPLGLMVAVGRAGPVSTPPIAIGIAFVLRDRLFSTGRHPAAECRRQSTRWLNNEYSRGNNRYRQSRHRLMRIHIETSPFILGVTQSSALISINLSALHLSIEGDPKFA